MIAKKKKANPAPAVMSAERNLKAFLAARTAYREARRQLRLSLPGVRSSLEMAHSMPKVPVVAKHIGWLSNLEDQIEAALAPPKKK